nr:hypothetical protein [Baekduia sp.]
VVTLAVVLPGLYWYYRKDLQVSPRAKEALMQLDAAAAIENPSEAKRTVPVLLGSILVFFVHKQLHLEPATVAGQPAVDRGDDRGYRVAHALLPDRAVRDGRSVGGDRCAG